MANNPRRTQGTPAIGNQRISAIGDARREQRDVINSLESVTQGTPATGNQRISAIGDARREQRDVNNSLESVTQGTPAIGNQRISAIGDARREQRDVNNSLESVTQGTPAIGNQGNRRISAIGNARQQADLKQPSFRKFELLPLDLRTEVILHALKSDKERRLGDMYLVCKSWKNVMQGVYFATLFRHVDHCLDPKRIRVILQTTNASKQDAHLWDLLCESGKDPKWERKAELPHGRYLIGTSGPFVAISNLYGGGLIVVRDWLTLDLGSLGRAEGASVCFVYGISCVLRVFLKHEIYCYELLRGGSWSKVHELEFDVNDKGCCADGYFGLLCNGCRFLLTIDQASDHYYVDALPPDVPGRRFSHHLIERRGMIHLCTLTNIGLDTYSWNCTERVWVYLSRFPLIVGGDPSQNWRVFGVGDDNVLVSFFNYIHLVDVVTKGRILSTSLPETVSKYTEITAGYINGCKCSWVKHLAWKRSQLGLQPD